VTDSLRALQIGEEQRAQVRERTARSKHPVLWMSGLALGGIVAAGMAWLGLRSKPMPVPATTVIPVSHVSGGLLTAGGYVRHARVVNVVPRVSGIIATLRVSEGDIVRKGDIIATLDGEELRQQVAESRAELRATQARLAELKAGGRREEIASACAKVDALRLTAARLEREKERSKALAEAGALSAQVREGAENASLVATKTLEAEQQALSLLKAGARSEAIATARAALDGARARLARINSNLGRAEIRAPLSGRVLRKFVDVGAVVSFGLPYTENYVTLGPGSPIVSIGQLEGLEAVADINQTDLGRISTGEKVEVRADAFPDKTYHARVSRFSPRADRNKNTVEVMVRFEDPVPGELAHDMSVKLSFLGNPSTLGVQEHYGGCKRRRLPLVP
jgi:HlyD family secretion protein